MLGHIYLSGDRPKILVGSFIGEMKTVNDLSIYKKEIRDGIKLHQNIDEFFYSHPAVAESKKRLNPKYTKYSDAIINFFYDHFLAANWKEFSDRPMEKFALNAYVTLVEYQDILPYKAKRLLPIMIRGKWLTRFTTLGGISHVVSQMEKKSTKHTHIVSALEDLISGYQGFKQDFSDFFPKLIQFVNTGASGTKEVYKSKPENIAWAG